MTAPPDTDSGTEQPAAEQIRPPRTSTAITVALSLIAIAFVGTLGAGVASVGGPQNLDYLFHQGVAIGVAAACVFVVAFVLGLLKGHPSVLVGAAGVLIAISVASRPQDDIGEALGALAFGLLVAVASTIPVVIAAARRTEIDAPWQSSTTREWFTVFVWAIAVPWLAVTMVVSLAVQGSPPEDFTGRDLAGRVFDRNDLVEARFVDCTLDHASFASAYAVAADFTGASLEGARLDDISCHSCRFVSAALDGASMHEGRFFDADFTDASLRGADLTNVKLGGATMDRADLTDANLRGADIETTPPAGLVTVVWGNTTCPDGTNSDEHGGTCAGHLGLTPPPTTLAPFVGLGDITAGQCLATEAGDFRSVVVVSCDEIHDGQVLVRIAYPAIATLPYPGEAIVGDFANRHCNQTAGSYIRDRSILPEIVIHRFYPTQRAWDAGERDIVCIVSLRDSEPMTGNLLTGE